MAKNFGRVNVSITASTGGLTAGLSRASKQLKGFQSGVAGMSALSGSLGTMMPMLLPVVGGFTTLAGAIAALTSATRAAEALHNLSQELGVAVGDLQVLQQVAAETGVSQEALTTGLRRTARMVGELGQGSKPAQKAFAQLGLTMQDLAGLSTAQQFSLISQRIAALPPQMQAAAAIDIFGRSGQGLLNFIRTGSQSIGEMDTLLTALGVKMSGPQVAAIEAMGDAIGRLMLPMQGFVNQFLSGLAPAVTAAAEIIMEFFTSTNNGFSYATLATNLFIVALKGIVGIGSIIVATFQIMQGIILGVLSAIVTAFGALSDAVGATEGMERFGEALGEEAASSFANAVQNFENPLQNFDSRMADAQQQAAASAVKPLENAGVSAGQSIGSAIKAASSELRALVVGSSEGESFRNSLARGGDARLSGGDAAKATADNTERAADGIEDVAAAVREIPGFGQAQLAMV
jgi:hypothetical protein